MPSTRKLPGAAVIVDEPQVTMLGDEPPDPRFVNLADPRTAALHDLLTPPVIVESDLAPVSTLAPGLVRPIPAVTEYRWNWVPDGDWYLVCANYYDRDFGQGRVQSRTGDLVRLSNDATTREHLALQYIVPSPIEVSEE